MILTYTISTSTRANALTSTLVTTKKVTPSIDGKKLIHEYIFDGAVSDISAKAIVKSDLELAKGYGALIEG